jgi:hypothetical protein
VLLNRSTADSSAITTNMPINHALVRGVAVRGGRMNPHTASTENAIREIQSCVVALHGTRKPNATTAIAVATNNAMDQRVAVTVVMFIAPDTPSSRDLLDARRQYTASAMMVASGQRLTTETVHNRRCRSGVGNSTSR